MGERYTGMSVPEPDYKKLYYEQLAENYSLRQQLNGLCVVFAAQCSNLTQIANQNFKALEAPKSDNSNEGNNLPQVSQKP